MFTRGYLEGPLDPHFAAQARPGAAVASACVARWGRRRRPGRAAWFFEGKSGDLPGKNMEKPGDFAKDGMFCYIGIS